MSRSRPGRKNPDSALDNPQEKARRRQPRAPPERFSNAFSCHLPPVHTKGARSPSKGKPPIARRPASFLPVDPRGHNNAPVPGVHLVPNATSRKARHPVEALALFDIWKVVMYGRRGIRTPDLLGVNQTL